MRIVDVNVLIYAVHSTSLRHDSARRWLDEALRQRTPLGFPWVTTLGFIRLTTNPRIVSSPLSTQQATSIVETWLDAPCSIVVEPTPRHLSLLSGLLASTGSAGNLTTDAHLACLAIEYGAEIVTYDRDFERFGVRTLIPG